MRRHARCPDGSATDNPARRLVIMPGINPRWSQTQGPENGARTCVLAQPLQFRNSFPALHPPRGESREPVTQRY